MVMNEVEKLELELQTTSANNRVDVLNMLAWQLYRTDVSQAQKYAEEALQLAKDRTYKRGIACSHQMLSFIFRVKGAYETAVLHAQTALPIFTQLADKNEIAQTHLALAMAYLRQGHYRRALDDCLQALRLFEIVENEWGQAMIYNVVSVIYSHQSDKERALDYRFRAAAIFERLGGQNDTTYRLQQYRANLPRARCTR